MTPNKKQTPAAKGETRCTHGRTREQGCDRCNYHGHPDCPKCDARIASLEAELAQSELRAKEIRTGNLSLLRATEAADKRAEAAEANREWLKEQVAKNDAIARAEAAEARAAKLEAVLAELVNLHSGQDWKNRGSLPCSTCEKALKLLKEPPAPAAAPPLIPEKPEGEYWPEEFLWLMAGQEGLLLQMKADGEIPLWIEQSDDPDEGEGKGDGTDRDEPGTDR